MSSKIIPYIELMRLNKPIGIFLLLWPTLIALWIASEGRPDPFITLLFIAGVIIMRSAGCIINDITDRSLDKQVERTKKRPLTSETISVYSAVYLLIVLLFLAAIIVLQFNILTIQLSFLALILTFSYPWMKRYFEIPQAILGLTFAMGIPMAFAAINNKIDHIAYILLFANFCWIMAYDTQYALMDKSCDFKTGIKSSAIFFGRYDKLMILIFQFLFLATLTYVGYYLNFGKLFYSGILLSALLMLYQLYLIRYRDPVSCLKAFLNNNYVGLVLFVTFFISYK